VRDLKNLPDSGHLYARTSSTTIWRITAQRQPGHDGASTRCGAQYYHHEAASTRSPRAAWGQWVFALPAPIGQSLPARTEKSGHRRDGGFQMTAAELSTMPRKASRSTSPSSNTLPGMCAVAGVFLRTQLEATPLSRPTRQAGDAPSGSRTARSDRSEVASAAKRLAPRRDLPYSNGQEKIRGSEPLRRRRPPRSV